MAERLEDLNLPNAVVGRLIKDALPDGVIISKEARTAVTKAASVFIIYLTSNAVEVSQKGNRKVLSGSDILEALENIEFDEFVQPLQEFWEIYKDVVKKKKELKGAQKAAKKEAAASEANIIEIDDEEVMEVIDDDDEEENEVDNK